jgi:Mrp family chromosome partitioning ATPase
MVGGGGGRPLLRTYAWLIVTVTAVTILTATALVTLRPTMYASSSSVVVTSAPSAGTPVPVDMGTQREIARSGQVAARAAEQLGLPSDTAAHGLSVSVPIDATALTISYSAASPQEALAGAKAFTQAYIDYLNESDPPAPNASMITAPKLPTDPIGTNYPLVIGLSLLLGAMIGVGAALVWDKTTDRLRNVDDTEASTGLPVLASIPLLKSRKRNRTAALAGPPAPGAEALGYLTSQLMHAMTTRRATSVLVTSPSPGAGKTTIAVSVATSLAKVGRDIVLVDVLNGSTPLHHALRTHDLEGLRVITRGTGAAQDAASFNLDDLQLLLGRLTKTADVVVIDAPTVLGAPDTALLADGVDAVVLVVDLRYGLRADAVAAVTALNHVEDKLVGCVTNRPRRQPRRLRWSIRPRRRAPRNVPEDQRAEPAETEAPELESRPAQAVSAQPSSDEGLGILRWSERRNGDEDGATYDSDETEPVDDHTDDDHTDDEYDTDTYEIEEGFHEDDEGMGHDNDARGHLEPRQVESGADQDQEEGKVNAGLSSWSGSGNLPQGKSRGRRPRL